MDPIPDSQKVSYPFLGRSGLKVANICLGAMTFGKNGTFPGQTDEAESHAILDRYTEWGGNFIDTADMYSGGESESIVGTWLNRQQRENFVIATKCFFASGPEGNVNRSGLSRRHITNSVEMSLERLRTDYIDLFQPHDWDDATPVEETLRTLDDLVRCGKVLYVGYCNVTGWQMQKLVDTASALGLNPIISLQQQYNLENRESELEPFQVCKKEGIAVLPWSPLKCGLFSGKIQRNVVPQEGRLGWVAQNEAKRTSPAGPPFSKFTDKTFNILDTLGAIAKAKGRSIPQIAIRWLLQKDVVPSVIIGARTLEHLDDDMAAANGWELSGAEMQELDDVSSTDVPYPYEMVFTWNKARANPSLRDHYVRSTHK